MRTVRFTINGREFIFPSDFITQEHSSSSLSYSQTEDDQPIPMAEVSTTLSINMEMTTGSLTFINTYSLFKAAIEYSAYQQTINLPEKNQDYKRSPPKFSSYWGINEYMENGQIQTYSFSASHLRSNTFQISLSFQKKQFKPSSPKPIEEQKPDVPPHQLETQSKTTTTSEC